VDNKRLEGGIYKMRKGSGKPREQILQEKRDRMFRLRRQAAGIPLDWPKWYNRRGENNANAKLTWVGVRRARQLYDNGKAGRSIGSLAREFGVRHATMWAILRDKTWTDEGLKIEG
jgi:hypothetical protein